MRRFLLLVPTSAPWSELWCPQSCSPRTEAMMGHVVHMIPESPASMSAFFQGIHMEQKRLHALRPFQVVHPCVSSKDFFTTVLQSCFFQDPDTLSPTAFRGNISRAFRWWLWHRPVRCRISHKIKTVSSIFPLKEKALSDNCFRQGHEFKHNAQDIYLS